MDEYEGFWIQGKGSGIEQWREGGDGRGYGNEGGGRFHANGFIRSVRLSWGDGIGGRRTLGKTTGGGLSGGVENYREG